MSIDSRISSFENVFEGWKIGEFIGGGSGGKSSVYEISRKNFDFVEEDVIKIINIIFKVRTNNCFNHCYNICSCTLRCDIQNMGVLGDIVACFISRCC